MVSYFKIKIAAGALFALALMSISARAEVLPEQPVPGIIFSTEVRTNRPQRLFVAQIDLTNPKVHLRVAPGGPDPDGEGRWETTLMPPTKIAAREKFDFVVNGDFFVARGVNDGEGTNSHYRAEQWALTEGPSMTDGKTWSTSTNARPCLVVHTNRSVTIEMLQRPGPDNWEVISGNVLLVHEGKIVPHAKSAARHPRTVAGIDPSGKTLTILLVDGRKPGIALGMTYDELAAEMLRLGCWDVVNLDGGGSSVMALRDASGAMKILNVPTDGRERAVANVFGVSVDRN